MTARQTVLGKGRRITLPRAVLEEASFVERQALRAECTPEGVLLRRVEERDPDQWWFWTEEWQKGEREADEDIKAGRFTFYATDEAFIAALEARIPPETP